MGNVLLVSCVNRVLVIIFAGGWGGGGNVGICAQDSRA